VAASLPPGKIVIAVFAGLAAGFLLWVAFFCLDRRRRQRQQKNMLRRMTLDIMRNAPTRTIYFGDTASTRGSRYASMAAEASPRSNESDQPVNAIRRVSDTGEDEIVEVVSFRAFGGGRFSSATRKRGGTVTPGAAWSDIPCDHYRRSLQPEEESSLCKEDVARVRAMLASWDAFTTSNDARHKVRRSLDMTTRRSSVTKDELDPLDPGPPASMSSGGYAIALSDGTRRAMSLILRNAESSTDWRELIDALPPYFLEAHMNDREERRRLGDAVARAVSPTWSVTTTGTTTDCPPSTPGHEQQGPQLFLPGHRARARSEGGGILTLFATKRDRPGLKARPRASSVIVAGGRADDDVVCPGHGIAF
jgi:hypothetical protein